MTRSALVVLVLAALAGCKKGNEAPDCKAAANRYASLVKQQVDRDNAGDESKKAQALSLIPSLKEEMVQACKKDKWTDEIRRCIAEAKDAPDLPRCMPNVPLGGTPEAPPAAAPSKSGG